MHESSPSSTSICLSVMSLAGLGVQICNLDIKFLVARMHFRMLSHRNLVTCWRKCMLHYFKMS